jgi:uncharacterized protein (TIGR00369 family)
MDDTHERIARRCESAGYNAGLGIRVESIDAVQVRLRVPYKDENSNPGQALHGGVAASTIDIAGALVARACLIEIENADCGTLDLSVDYLAAAIGEDIVATATVLRRGKELVYSDVDVRTDAGKQIAKGLVTHRIVERATVAADRQRFSTAEAAPADVVEVPKNAAIFVSLPFIARLGMVVTHARDGEAFMRMPFGDHVTDVDGAFHEGALAALIDTTGAMASWSITGLNFRYKASTVGIHVSFHARAEGEDVIAHARTLRRNDEVFLNHVTVSGAASHRVFATGSVTYRIVVP